MHPQSNYEQARDEAAAIHYDIYSKRDAHNRSEGRVPVFVRMGSFKAGSDFGRSYEQKVNADLLDDCKAMREALEFYSLKSNYSLVDEGRNYDVDYKCYELNEKTYGDEDLGTKARQVLSQLKGKYDEQTRN